MPTLFISYKRGTAAVAPLMDKLRAAGYRLWFDRDEIHLGDPDWQARIDQGLSLSAGVILNITPAACESEPVRYEVRKALELGKPIFPIILERIAHYDAAITALGLPAKAHIEDFTDVTRWDAQIERLLRDLELQGLRVTRHDRRQQRDRNNPTYLLHQTYLKRLAERIGTLNLAQINPDNAQGVELERVYVDSPTRLSLSVEVQDWQVIDWWMGEEKQERGGFGLGEQPDEPRRKPGELGYETAPFETLIGEVDARIAEYRQENPDKKPDEEHRWENPWNNGAKRNLINLHLNHLAAARDRLVILGAPGSGKSTFVKFLALCLAGSGMDDWTREASIAALDNWPHGALTPVYVELRRFVASKHFPAELNAPATADHLWAYIEHEVLGDDLRAYADDLRYDLEHGHAALILDGLDEVPYPEGKLKQRQGQLISLAQSLNTRYATSRIIVASRPYAYEGWALPGFQAVMITKFKNDHRTALASRLYRTAGLDDDAAQEKARALNRQLQQIDDELKDRPLFVTLMATIYLRGDSEGLPTRRGALYRESILLLLDRWTQGKPGAPSLIEILGDKSLDELYARLAALAYEVHEQYGEQPGTPEIDESLLYKHLKPLGRSIAAELIPYLSENAGVLVCPGQDDQKDVFHFAHRTFQEYLAAAHLMTLCAEADSFALVREQIVSKPQVWRVPCVLAGDVLADTERRSNLWNLIDDLMDDEALTLNPSPSGRGTLNSLRPEGEGPGMRADDPRWWGVWLSAVIVEEQKLHEQTTLRRGERAIRDGLVDWLVRLVKTAQALLPPERAQCGRALGLLGDPRKGVGLRPDGLPDIDWVPIPDDGEWFYQKDKHPPLPAFQMSRYPVTYAQFQAFIDAPDFNDDRWWAGMPDEQKVFDTNYRTRELNKQTFKYSNHPRENVSWYQAVAFCRWLSDKLGYEVTLPTERQWEKAARGTDGREYPYAGGFDATKGNTRETGIGQTSAVGIFAEGRSPYDILDMSGNVWEWCLNKDHEPDQIEIDNSGDFRTLRGGSCYFRGISRTVDGSISDPISCDSENGFRVVCVAPHLDR
ncbi:MAG: SUMF1/EgtB/PvdO family nonheme iron enzyme [Chloroflexota bacterium]|nr:SUMF1/EgtB/PvdO family nonheme iron enzyme [Chloroflexota bacterium]